MKASKGISTFLIALAMAGTTAAAQPKNSIQEGQGNMKDEKKNTTVSCALPTDDAELKSSSRRSNITLPNRTELSDRLRTRTGIIIEMVCMWMPNLRGASLLVA